MNARNTDIERFLVTAGWAGATCHALPGDASFRRYARLVRDGQSVLLMDAPPPHENVEAFARVAAMLLGLGLSAPKVLARDPAAGLLLIEDFGDDSFTRVLAEGGDERPLYDAALDVLIALHRAFRCEKAAGLAAYDDDKLMAEAALLVDWYLPAIRGQPTPAGLRDEYEALWRSLLADAEAVPRSLVLRDFHVDNLMWLRDRPGVRACGLLDFQDAVTGPVTYDLVSLFEDARRDVPKAMAETMLDRYLNAFPEIDPLAFRTSYAVLGAQRAAKVIGIFTRLDRRDGKPVYLDHIPRVWRWLEGDLAHPRLAPLAAWFDRVIPAGDRRRPDSEGAR